MTHEEYDTLLDLINIIHQKTEISLKSTWGKTPQSHSSLRGKPLKVVIITIEFSDNLNVPDSPFNVHFSHFIYWK